MSDAYLIQFSKVPCFNAECVNLSWKDKYI